MKHFLSTEYWSERYKQNETAWDLGQISPPIKEYIDQLTNKELKILIPGCGLGHEGEYLFRIGFNNVFLLDLTAEPLLDFKKRNPEFPQKQLVIGDFFEHVGKYDLIIEQTLFCALNPSLRSQYAEKTAELLCENGKLVGLLFNRDFVGGPPFGGNKEEYLGYFQNHFSTVEMNECKNSIAPRQGTELFINLVK
jgi:thiopurine S-methyltransferase